MFKVSHRQYVFLMHLLRSLKTLQQTLQQDLEAMASKRERKDTSQPPADHKPFTFCLGLLLKSVEVSLLMKPMPQPEGSGSPVGSDLSPSESRGTLEPGSDAREGSVKGNEEPTSQDGGAAVDQLLCGAVPEGGATLIPSLASEETPAKNTEREASDEGAEAVVDGLASGEEVSSTLDSKTSVGDPLSDLNEKEKTTAAKIPQSISR